jgi:hypothetical protein
MAIQLQNQNQQQQQHGITLNQMRNLVLVESDSDTTTTTTTRTRTTRIRKPYNTGINVNNNNNNKQIQKQQGLHLWENNPNIPTWLQEYMAWHHQVTTTELSNATKHDYEYLVLRCYQYDERCGGVSDRLKPIPLLLLAAFKSKRLLFIHWHDRPWSLEEFLLPPPHGFNWTVPNFLIDDFLRATHGAITRAGSVFKATSNPGWIKAVHIHGMFLFVCG